MSGDREERRSQFERRAGYAAVTTEFLVRVGKHMDREDEREISEEARSGQWHLGKEIPLALLLFLLMQTMAAVWWAATQSATTTSLKEAEIARQIVQTAVDRRQDEDSQRSEARVTAQLTEVKRAIEALTTQLERERRSR